MKGKQRGSWSDVKVALQSWSTRELIDLVRDLYRLNSGNRRYLHTRLLDPDSELQWYKRRVVDSVAPDVKPYGRCRVRLSEAKNAIREYRLASSDPRGTLDLMLTFVEQGIEHYMDFGYDDNAFFDSLGSMLDEAVQMLSEAGDETQLQLLPRLKAIGERADQYGSLWKDVAFELITRDFPELYEG